MEKISKPFNEFQEAKYRIAYSTDTRKKVKATHYVVKYGEKVLCNPTTYALCQENLKQFKMMGAQFPDKSKLSIKPAKS